MNVNDSSFSSSCTSLKSQVLSASVGALLVSILVTPLDVVKVRIQTQTMSHGVAVTYAAPIKIYQVPYNLYRNSLRKGYSSRSFVFCSQLFDHVEPLLASPFPESQSPHRFKGTFDGIKHILHNEGISSLWRGLTPTLVMSVPATVVYLVGYEYLRQLFSGFSRDGLNWHLAHAASGASARLLAATVISPLELIRTRMQTLSKSHAKSPSSFVLNDIKNMVQVGGISSLWRGLVPTLFRDVPFSAIYWLSYENSKSFLMKHFAFMPRIDNHNYSFDFSVSFVSGLFAGSIAAFATTPFDVIKTRRQAEDLFSKSLPSSKMECHNSDRTAPAFKSLRSIFLSIYKEQGLKGLFAGLSARLLKVPPACAIMISSYEVGKRYLEFLK